MSILLLHYLWGILITLHLNYCGYCGTAHFNPLSQYEVASLLCPNDQRRRVACDITEECEGITRGHILVLRLFDY